jgi:hypothetical protein
MRECFLAKARSVTLLRDLFQIFFLWFNLSYYLRQVTVVNYPLLFSVCNVLALLLETHSGVVSVISPRKL